MNKEQMRRPERIERTLRIHIMTPELYEQVKIRAERGGVSTNELATIFGISRETARKVKRSASFDEYKSINREYNCKEVSGQMMIEPATAGEDEESVKYQPNRELIAQIVREEIKNTVLKLADMLSHEAGGSTDDQTH